MAVLSKILKKTDIKKRLHVPTKNKTCFLNFGGQLKVEFKAIDENGKVWRFVCSRREGNYPKPVLSEGWLQFVRWWNLAVGDEVILSKARGHYRIEIRRASRQTTALPPPVQSHDAERTMAIAGYVEEDPTLLFHSTYQVITNNQTEGQRNLEFISLTPGSQVIQPFIDFFQQESRSQPETERKRRNQAL